MQRMLRIITLTPVKTPYNVIYVTAHSQNYVYI